MGEHAAERVGERDTLPGQRRQIEVPRKARARFLGRHHFEELLLPRGIADGGEQFGFGALVLPHGKGLAFTVAPAGNPSLSGGTT